VRSISSSSCGRSRRRWVFNEAFDSCQDGRFCGRRQGLVPSKSATHRKLYHPVPNETLDGLLFVRRQEADIRYPDSHRTLRKNWAETAPKPETKLCPRRGLSQSNTRSLRSTNDAERNGLVQQTRVRSKSGYLLPSPNRCLRQINNLLQSMLRSHCLAPRRRRGRHGRMGHDLVAPTSSQEMHAEEGGDANEDHGQGSPDKPGRRQGSPAPRRPLGHHFGREDLRQNALRALALGPLFSIRRERRPGGPQLLDQFVVSSINNASLRSASLSDSVDVRMVSRYFRSRPLARCSRNPKAVLVQPSTCAASR